MYVVLIARQNGKIPTMARVRELLCLPSEAPNRFVPGDEGKGIPKLAQVMMRSGRPGLCNLAGQFTDWYGEIKSIRSNAMRQTKCFDAPQIARNIARNDFDFRDLKREPTTVYIVIPPPAPDGTSRQMGAAVADLCLAGVDASAPGWRTDYPLYFWTDRTARKFKNTDNGVHASEKIWNPDALRFPGYVAGQGYLQRQVGVIPRKRGRVAVFPPNDPTTAEWLSKASRARPPACCKR